MTNGGWTGDGRLYSAMSAEKARMGLLRGTVEQSFAQEASREKQRVQRRGHVQPGDCDAGEERGERAVTGATMVLRQLIGIVGARGIL